MPLDPNIPLGIQPVKIRTPGEQAILRAERDRLEQGVRANELKLRQEEKDLRDQMAVQRILQESGGDLSGDTLGRIRAVSPKLAMDFEANLSKLRKESAEAMKNELDNERGHIEYGLGLLSVIPEGDDETYQAIKPLILKRMPDLANVLPETYDAERLRFVQQRGLTAKERAEFTQKALDAALSGDWRYYAGVIANEDDPNDRAIIRQAYLNLGAPRAVLDAMEANPQAAAMTESERQQAADRQADNLRQDAQFDETKRHNLATEDVAAGNLAVARGRLGVAQQQARAGSAQASSSLPPEYATALDRAILAIPAVRRPAIVALADRLYKSGDEQQLKEVIMQAAIETENVDTKNQIRGRHDAAAAVRDIRASLAELKESGVDTNILRGGVEDVARKLGTSTDPRLAEVGTRILDAYVSYRRSLTGVQFSERESAEYIKLFPNYKNTLPLNEAILRGLERAMATRDREFWTSKLGPSGAKLVGAVEDPPQKDDSGGAAQRRPIPGIPGAEAELRNGRWIRVK